MITTTLKLAKIIKKLNPNARLIYRNHKNGGPILESSIPAELLVLPKPFYYNVNLGITNKQKKSKDGYISLNVIYRY